MSAAETSLPVGTVLADKFRVVRVLGAGAMGVVYEIEHELTRHRRALKLLHPEVRERPGVVERFVREASAAGRIGNAHIIETFDAGALDSGQPYVVMELLVGETLSERLQAALASEPRRMLELDEIAELVGQACDGVQAAHDAGIVHRDLKPDNLFVTTRDGAPFVKVLDFGVSKFDVERTGEMVLTQEGTTIGTPLYMSPEQIRGAADVDARADVYALGAILYECAAGVVPFVPKSLTHLAVLIHEGAPPPLESVRPDLPRAFCDIVARAMAVDREGRIQTARELGQALRDVRVRSSREAFDATVPLGRSEPPSSLSRPSSMPARIGSTSTTAVAASGAIVSTRRSARMYYVAGGIAVAGALGAWVSVSTGRRSPSAQIVSAAANAPVAAESPSPASAAVSAPPVEAHDAGALARPAPRSSSHAAAVAAPAASAPRAPSGRNPLVTENPFK